MVSVFLCDPQPILAEGLKAILRDREDFQFAGSAPTLEGATAFVRAEQPDVVIVDRSFGMHRLAEWSTQMKASSVTTQIVIWAATITDVDSFKSLQAGARGVIRKTGAITSIFDCLAAVSRRELWTETLDAAGRSLLDEPRTRPLTPREQQVAELVAKGMKNREIAEALDIATGTVKIHLMHIFEKTGIRDRFELALHGLRMACDREGSAAAEPVPPAQPAEGAGEQREDAGVYEPLYLRR